MSLSRRKFLRLGAGAAALSTAGCENLIQTDWFFARPSDEGPFDPPDSRTIDLTVHLINRLSFGARPGDYARVKAMGPDAYLLEQLAPESIEDRAAERLVRRLESLDDPPGELFEYKEEFLLDEMTRATILRAVYTRRQLYEVMVNFWTDHFNIDSSKGDCRWLKAADDRDVIRAHAMGRFSDLVRASALSPAMLWYLDGRVNRKASKEEKPNENYARELLELHTLGIHGGYTQRDVMEVARCLTGWTVRANGTFRKGRLEFKSDLHDDGAKTVLGHEIPEGLGRGDLDRVLEIVTQHPSTARYIASKLCRRFIADEPPREAVRTVAAAFTASGGDVRETLAALFATEEFLAARCQKFKRPFRFMVSALRATGARTDGGAPLLEYLLRMGHAPFQYPTPDGYPDEQSPWLGTMLWRWHFASALAENRLEGTTVDLEALRARIGGKQALMAHLLGRRPNEVETASFSASGAGEALMLASPAFQRC